MSEAIPPQFHTSKSENKNFLIKTTFILKRSSRWLVFLIFFLFNVIMNIDNGTINCSDNEMKSFFFGSSSETNKQMGFFKCIVFLGITFGSIISAFIINKINRKYFLITSACFNGVCLFLFSLKIKSFYIYLLLRFCVGIFQSFVSIYLPAWCNQFGIKERRTIMLGLVQIGVPLGVILGYGMTVFCMNSYKIKYNLQPKEPNLGWKYTYRIQACMLWVIMFVILFIPNKFFLSRAQQMHKSLKKERNVSIDNDEHTVNTIFYDTRNSQIERTETDFQNTIHSLSMTRINKRNNCFNEFFQVIKQPIFFFCTFTLTSLFFILTVIQFEGTEYMMTVLNAENLTQTLICFAIICLTSPTFGILIGSAIINCQGGYETRNSILICFISSFLSALCTIPASFATNIYTFTLYLWFVLFFGAAIVPPLNGIIMSSIRKELVGIANSILIMICNLLGYLPAPSLYGCIQDLYGKDKDIKEKEKFTMKISLWSSGVGVFFLLIATIVRYNKFDEIYKDRKLSDDLLGDARKSMESTHSKTFIIQYMNGMVSGIEENNEIEYNNLGGIQEDERDEQESKINPIDSDPDKYKLVDNDTLN